MNRWIRPLTILCFLSLGTRLSADVAVIVEPGVISSAEEEFSGISFSPDGKEAFWSRRSIVHSVYRHGHWSQPTPIDFAVQEYRDTKPVVSAAGTEMVFASTRPIERLKPAQEFFLNLWISRKTSQGWSAPEPLPAFINTEWDEDFPVLAADGTLYFVSNRKGDHSTYRQFRSARGERGYEEPVEAGFPFLRENEALSGLAPDHSFALFTSMDRAGLGSADIYVSFRDPRDLWGPGINLGPEVNSPGVDWCGRVSPNGRFLYFSSDRNKSRDIYRIHAKVIRALRRKK